MLICEFLLPAYPCVTVEGEQLYYASRRDLPQGCAATLGSAQPLTVAFIESLTVIQQSNSIRSEIMFKELLPVLRDRAVLLTVTLVEADQIRVNIVPK
jgi:hypothetical protein